MFSKSLVVGVLSLAFAPAFALAGSTEPAQFQTVNVQARQGGSITLQVPLTPNRDAAREPYALLGQSQYQDRVVPMRFGQGGLVLVRLSN